MCLINTGLTTFDNQAKIFGTGNITSNTQYSSFLSSDDFENEVKSFDLQYDYRKIVEAFTKENKKSVLYKFFYKKRGKEEIVGYIVTDKNKEKYKVFGARTQKRKEALNSILNLLLIQEGIVK